MAYLRLLWSKFNVLSQSEKALIVALVALLLILFVYFAIWNPVLSYHQSSLAERDLQSSLIQHMRASEKQVRVSATGINTRPSDRPLISEVTSTAQRANIKPNRVQPEGSDAVNVWFDGVSFSDLLSWIVQLNEEQGIGVEQITIDRQDAPGIVNARLVLSSQ